MTFLPLPRLLRADLRLVATRVRPDAAATDEAQRYAGAGTLQNAVGILKDKLNREGKSELAGMVESSQGSGGQSMPAFRLTRPTCDEIGEPPLPRGAVRDRQAHLPADRPGGNLAGGLLVLPTSGVETRDGITYDHHRVRLVLEALDRGKPFHFSLLVLDVFYGPVERKFGPRAVNLS